jgi:NAD-dependent dihydropyrimidine dehydrogenase PreA subunit
MSAFLRPPGVVSEQDLKARCIACGQCAQVCNYNCIVFRPDHILSSELPRVYQLEKPCRLCMKCVEICPTKALREVPMGKAGMGMAHLDRNTCVDYQRQRSIMCWTCYERCPMKGTAIYLKNGYVPAVTDQCVGCGVCEYVCPIGAITVTPTRLRKNHA